ncbi:putative transcription factor Hap3/NF-YB family [Helianthus annuus]|nr:putative transcription factor Hap3/NF-YB family [Helianthus annuus]KAJ0818928.1 putative transcription factor Hap3/NF-YB family [Helianthus annuus]
MVLPVVLLELSRSRFIFTSARIKKIMQADEDVGKIAMAVPLLVSKALELFLQDLCDRTYEVTLQRGAKTLNSTHLKQCVQSFNVFDFLRDIVGKVPDLGGSDAAGEDRSAPKRRKVADGDHNDGDEIEDSKRDKRVRFASMFDWPVNRLLF